MTLERPGYSVLPEHRIAGHEQNRGDSHLALVPQAPAQSVAGVDHLQISTETPDGLFVVNGLANEKGFLGTLVVESVSAKNLADARLRSSRAVAPALSNLSAHLDIPLRVHQTEVIEMCTGARHLFFQAPYNDAPFIPPPRTTLSDDFMRQIGYYREALGSNTPAYQFLCFYKIIEGIRNRRKRAARADKRSGRQVPSPVREIVPSERSEFVPWLNAIYPVRSVWDDLDFQSIFLEEARGWEFNRILDDNLRRIRDGIAHSMLGEDELAVSADEIANADRVSRWLPLTKCMVRRMLKNQFPQEFLASLNEND